MKRAVWARMTGLGTVAALACSACTLLPYPTATPKALQRDLKAPIAADGTPRAVAARGLAFCYNQAFNSPKELMDEARLLCADGKVTFYDTDILWTPCSLLQPSRATFLCTPRQNAGAKTPQTPQTPQTQ